MCFNVIDARYRHEDSPFAVTTLCVLRYMNPCIRRQQLSVFEDSAVQSGVEPVRNTGAECRWKGNGNRRV